MVSVQYLPRVGRGTAKFPDCRMNLRTLMTRSKRLFRNACLDLRYGAFLGGTRKTPYSHLGIEDTANTDYGVLPLIFNGRIHDSDVLVDVGCGKGRVINWWLSQGLRNRIIGIEIDGAVARVTQKRLEGFRNVEIVTGDVIQHLPMEGTLFYLFNPFKAVVVEAFKNRMEQMFPGRRDITILYYNCVHKEIFGLDLNWSVHTVELRGSLNAHPLAVIQWRG